MKSSPTMPALTLVIAGGTASFFMPAVSIAAIHISGDVQPDQSGLSTTHDARVGESGIGSLTIDDGSRLASNYGTIGASTGSSGSVWVHDSGTAWDIERDLVVGSFGQGVLTIQDGASVSVGRDTSLGLWPPGSGTIEFDQGTLTTQSLYADFDDLAGAGTIHTQGAIADEIDITFSPTLGLSQQIPLNQLPGQNISLHLDQTQQGILGAGYDGAGSVTIRDGISVDSYQGFLGYLQGSSGQVTVTGADSQWNIERSLFVGQEGHGVLHIADSAAVNVGLWTHVGRRPGGTGVIEFDHGTLNTDTLAVDITELKGTGTIYANGLVAEGYDLLFDASHGVSQTIQLNSQPGQDITVHLGQNGLNVLGVGRKGTGSLVIRDGVSIFNDFGYVGYMKGSKGQATVSGQGTRWWPYSSLFVGVAGDGELTIEDGALVQTEHLTLHSLPDYYGNSSYVNLINGGMLAIRGEADGSIMDFYELIYHQLTGWYDTLRYWDATRSDWAGITGATPGEDYTLEYFDSGEFEGYTMLTVHTTPEPGTLLLLGCGYVACFKGCRRV